MLFINIGLLAGLAAVLAPIAIHLWSQRKRQRVEWAAVRFLRRSVDVRKHKVEFENALLMAARCLLIALVALAVARPFIPDGSGASWALVIPLGIAAVCGLGGTVAVWRNRQLRAIVLPITLIALLLCAGLLVFERQLNQKRLGAAGKQDIAIIIDASMSMTAGADGGNFKEAIKEVRTLVSEIDGGDPLAIILAGPAPEDLTPGLVRDRASMDEKLGAATSSNGAMATLAAIERALAVLQEGSQPSKKIVMMTDAQVPGWQLDEPELWRSIEDRLDAFAVAPQLVMRRFEFPKPFRNAAIARIEFNPPTVMVNQTGTITVVIENTGVQAITPSALEVQVDGVSLPVVPMDQIAPGEVRPIPLPYRFRKAGTVAVSAALGAGDDISDDNSAAAVGFVRDSLQVLIIDGNPAGEPLDRGSAFLALALESATTEGVASGVQLSPEVITADAFDARPNLEGIGAVALCEVRRLPRDAAQRLAQFVARGGGLIIAPGEGSDPAFYNAWLHKTQPVLPAKLGEHHRLSMIRDKLGPQPASFQMGMFEFLSDDTQSDIASMLVARYHTLQKREHAEVLGRLRDGDPLFVGGELGEGKVFVSAVAFHPDSSNLVTREVFLPIIHELVLGISGDAGLDLDLAPVAELLLALPTRDAAGGNLPPGATLTAASGDRLNAEIHPDQGGFSATWDWDGVSGMHDLSLPQSVAALLPRGLADDGGAVRFTVSRDVEESRKNLLTAADLAAISERIHLIEAANVEDVQAVLAGQPVGEELWRTLVIAALVVLVLESLLTRYITAQRKTAGRDGLKFGPDGKVGAH